ncbi:tRNA lysidine(34) synthetase TilS [Chengkuizengella sediminis]|uniref:tRNA lysidine(34) synthetase TilS n=1 Tax=Chengkuizengella sediminis TaxID=1885917 RepID=UPI00138A1DC0|nr:tRNA lysidine(34) synthetase TilS [Chengkuizengella sediminis]NDI37051.1 tRNA lysidine(34) synthetase TilS [Chengkuizengella sediminis]
MELVQNVEKTIKEKHLFEAGEKIIVALSGGPDSMAMLHILHTLSSKWNFKLIAVHINHQFRGIEADQEEMLVHQWCNDLQVPCEIGKIDVPAYIEQTGKNAQAAAREKRYEFLFQIAEQYGSRKITLAHHADDQAETILMRLIRGTGPEGLTGISMRRMENKMQLIRPLLRIYKSEILTYCHQNHLKFTQDSSNQQKKYFRNEIRLDVIPYLKQYNQKLEKSLNRLSEMMTEEQSYLEQETNRYFKEIIKKNNNGFYFSRKTFISLHIALQRRLIKLILSYLCSDPYSFEYKIIEMCRVAIEQNSTSTMHLDVSEQIFFIREYDQVGFSNQKMNQDLSFSYKIEENTKQLEVFEANVLFEFAEQLVSKVDLDILIKGRLNSEVIFDMNQLFFPLSIRNRKLGDRMQIKGLNGTKKVKDIFIDEKIPPSKREKIPLLVDAKQQVLWIPGIRVSSHAEMEEKTSRILHIQYKNSIL